MNQGSNVNLVTTQKDTIELDITVIEDNAPLDITGYVFYFIVKDDIDDEDSAAIINASWATHTDPENGQTFKEIPKANTNFTGEKEYGIVYVSPSGVKKTFAKGKLTFEKCPLQETT